MVKILITGFSGFVSRHFLAHLEQSQTDAEVLGISRSAPGFPIDGMRHVRCKYHQLDLLDRSGVDELIFSFRPTHVLHLAAYSSVGFSWKKPVESFSNNTNVLLNLLDQIRELGLRCRVLSIGSSEQYGNVDASMLPLVEEAPLSPLSPYAAARVAQEILSKVYVTGYGLDVVMTRSFNHIGPHQRDVFVVPSLAKQLASVRFRGAEPRLRTGTRAIVRDFIDVRDVARAYHDLLFGGTTGEIYNVCTGVGTSIEEVVTMMQELLGTDVELETDPRLIRPSDNPIIIGSPAKIEREIGWAPRIGIRDSLATIVDWWSASVR